MVHLRHDFGGPEGTDFQISQAALRHPDLIVLHTSVRNGRIDEALYRRHPQRSWREVRIVLDGVGEFATADAGRTLASGEQMVCASFRDHQLRSRSDRLETLRVCWRRGSPLDGPKTFFGPTMSARVTERAAAVVRGLTDGSLTEETTRALLQTLASEGVSIRSEGWRDVSSVDDLRVGAAIERVLTPMRAAPAAVDLATALGCGERQALRLASAYFKRLHITVSSWRDYVVGLRIALATIAMTHPDARTDRVAAWLGFSSPTSLCHVFRSQRLPSPTDLTGVATA